MFCGMFVRQVCIGRADWHLGLGALVPVDWQRWAMGISTSIDVSIASFLIDSNFEQNTKHFESYSDH